jgi:hypothetical protein
MSDFDDLRQMREAKERTETLAHQKQMEEERQRFEVSRRMEERKWLFAKELNKTVTSVLEALRQALYPDQLIVVQGIERPRSLPYPDFDRCAPHWAITSSYYYPGADGGSILSVWVELEFNNDGQPLHFVCHRCGIELKEDAQFVPVYFEPIACDLTSEGLISALRKLHPPHTIDARPADRWGSLSQGKSSIMYQFTS